MNRIIQNILADLNLLLSQRSIGGVTDWLQPHLAQLQNYQFYFSNPLFGAIILIILLVLSKRWGLKNAFSYCLLTSAILYLTSKLNPYIDSPMMTDSPVTFADMAKIAAIFLIVLISVYYFFFKNR